jgi:hypothetical protein
MSRRRAAGESVAFSRGFAARHGFGGATCANIRGIPGRLPVMATGLIMRKAAILPVVTLLLGGCAVVSPPRSDVRPEPVPAPPSPATAAMPPQQATPQRPAPQRVQAVRIDNSSMESFRASWERMRASLSPAQQSDLSSAVFRLTFAPYGSATSLPANLRSSPIIPEIVRERIAGLTYAEIVALAP